MIDSQVVKNTCNASVESKGFCFYKCTNGIKRHLAVDTLGFPFFTHCTKANISDDQGLVEMLSQNLDYFRSKPVNIPKITILLDNGYHPEVMGSIEQTNGLVALPGISPYVASKHAVMGLTRCLRLGGAIGGSRLRQTGHSDQCR
jgi:NAD(P)-dependent dehydrogenase (short-subunit alcohol dehydrogenase family)